MPLRNDVEHRPDFDSLRPRRKRGTKEQTVRHDLITFVLEMVLRQPKDVVTEPFTGDADIKNLFSSAPALLLVSPPIHGHWRTSAGVIHLDSAEQKHTRTHPPRLGDDHRDGEVVNHLMSAHYDGRPWLPTALRFDALPPLLWLLLSSLWVAGTAMQLLRPVRSAASGSFE